MRLEKCARNHFYDADKYASCPHCAAELPDVTRPPEKIEKTEQKIGKDDKDEVTIIQTEGKFGSAKPTVGWLVCTKGKELGKDYRLVSDKNDIGRSTNMQVCLSDERTVSRDRHAIVIYDPKSNIFLAQPGDARELFYLNGNVVLTPVRMSKNDVLTVGEVELMLIPCCDDTFNWNK